MKKTLIYGSIVVAIALSLLGSFYLGKSFANNKNEQNKVDNTILSENDKIKLQNFINIIPAKSSIVNPQEDLTNDEKISIAMSLINKKNSTANFEQLNDYKGVEIKNNLVQNFGSTLNVELKNYKCQCGNDFYIYNKNTDVYTYNEEHMGHGSLAAFNVNNHIESYKVNGNTIIVEVSKIFTPDGGYLGPTPGYYLSYEDASKYGYTGDNIKTLPLGNSEYYSNQNIDYFEEVRKKEKNNLPIYTYTFEKVENNYIFKGYSLNK